MTTILLLFTLGIILLFLDLFLPGIILTVIGTLVILSGTARAFAEYGVGGGLIAFLISMVLLGLALWIEYGVLPKTRFGKKFFLHAAIEGTSQPQKEQMESLTGRECLVVTPLVPTGHVEIDGRRHEARSLDGQIPAGARVKITGTQNFSLTVTKL